MEYYKAKVIIRKEHKEVIQEASVESDIPLKEEEIREKILKRIPLDIRFMVRIDEIIVSHKNVITTPYCFDDQYGDIDTELQIEGA